jgi:hypothetical protein
MCQIAEEILRGTQQAMEKRNYTAVAGSMPRLVLNLKC